MAGKRQPTDIVKANGRKHLSQTEEDTRRDREIHVPSPEQVVPPRWLRKKFHQEFREIGEILHISRTAVQTRMSRARAMLKKELNGDDGEEIPAYDGAGKHG